MLSGKAYISIGAKQLWPAVAQASSVLCLDDVEESERSQQILWLLALFCIPSLSLKDNN
jgi:hypothetical protein